MNTGHCYKHFPSQVTWIEAQLQCQSLGGDLASVTNSVINDFLTTLTRDQAWIGGMKIHGNWQWTDGSTWGYTNWARNQPDDAHGGQDRTQFNWGETGKWDDVSGDHYNPGRPFICQTFVGQLFDF